ncbi:MAG: hypothetical protein GKR93_05820 [Gammaproteobacteria bacterium]|nr:hypothetical protein [Gammaproteobacteria bacterium]
MTTSRNQLRFKNHYSYSGSTIGQYCRFYSVNKILNVIHHRIELAADDTDFTSTLLSHFCRSIAVFFA